MPQTCIHISEYNPAIHSIVSGPYATLTDCQNACGSITTTTTSGPTTTTTTSGPTTTTTTTTTTAPATTTTTTTTASPASQLEVIFTRWS